MQAEVRDGEFDPVVAHDATRISRPGDEAAAYVWGITEHRVEVMMVVATTEKLKRRAGLATILRGRERQSFVKRMQDGIALGRQRRAEGDS